MYFNKNTSFKQKKFINLLNEKLKKKNNTLKNLNKRRYIHEMNNYYMTGGNNLKNDFLEILKQLEYYNRKYEKQSFKAKIYKNAVQTIKNLDDSTELNSENIKDLPGIGNAITSKLDEFISSGKVKNLQQLKEKYGTQEYNIDKIKQEKKRNIYANSWHW